MVMSDERDAKIWLAEESARVVELFLVNFGITLPCYDIAYIKRHIKGALISELSRSSLKRVLEAMEKTND